MYRYNGPKIVGYNSEEREYIEEDSIHYQRHEAVEEPRVRGQTSGARPGAAGDQGLGGRQHAVGRIDPRVRYMYTGFGHARMGREERGEEAMSKEKPMARWEREEAGHGGGMIDARLMNIKPSSKRFDRRPIDSNHSLENIRFVCPKKSNLRTVYLSQPIYPPSSFNKKRNQQTGIQIPGGLDQIDHLRDQEGYQEQKDMGTVNASFNKRLNENDDRGEDKPGGRKVDSFSRLKNKVLQQVKDILMSDPFYSIKEYNVSGCEEEEDSSDSISIKNPYNLKDESSKLKDSIKKEESQSFGLIEPRRQKVLHTSRIEQARRHEDEKLDEKLDETDKKKSKQKARVSSETNTMNKMGDQTSGGRDYLRKIESTMENRGQSAELEREIDARGGMSSPVNLMNLESSLIFKDEAIKTEENIQLLSKSASLIFPSPTIGPGRESKLRTQSTLQSACSPQQFLAGGTKRQFGFPFLGITLEPVSESPENVSPIISGSPDQSISPRGQDPSITRGTKKREDLDLKVKRTDDNDVPLKVKEEDFLSQRKEQITALGKHQDGIFPPSPDSPELNEKNIEMVREIKSYSTWSSLFDLVHQDRSLLKKLFESIAGVTECDELDQLSQVILQNAGDLFQIRSGNELIQAFIRRGHKVFMIRIHQYISPRIGEMALNDITTKTLYILAKYSPEFRKETLEWFGDNLNESILLQSGVFLLNSIFKVTQSVSEIDPITNSMKNTLLYDVSSSKSYKRFLISYCAYCSEEELDRLYNQWNISVRIMKMFNDKYRALVLLSFIRRAYAPVVNQLLYIIQYRLCDLFSTKFFKLMFIRMCKNDRERGLINKVNDSLLAIDIYTMDRIAANRSELYYLISMILMSADASLYKFVSSLSTCIHSKRSIEKLVRGLLLDNRSGMKTQSGLR